ncbi:adenylyl-sulfate kinase [Paenibacillus sp. WLX2291]|uniref:adenylyl-sulfate kinase n=1 Tax=Paenibacillus sp. WLX2291 TaxID=3296934 RepID=UPI0039843712
MMKSTNEVVWQTSTVSRQQREQRYAQRGRVLWLTGLPAAGKTTLAFALEQELFRQGRMCYVLDGDNIRHGLNADLGFSQQDRRENLRRIGEVCKLFLDAGHIVIAAFVSPYAQDRDRVRQLFAAEDFAEIHVARPLEVCELRDPKGMYARARAGEIAHFTGVDAPYEQPQSPELVINTEILSVQEAVMLMVETLELGAAPEEATLL